jgi:hypothetical protein
MLYLTGVLQAGGPNILNSKKQLAQQQRGGREVVPGQPLPPNQVRWVP